MRLFDALPNIDYVWPTISARDLDPVTANLEIEAISFRSCAKHVQDEVRGPEYVAPLLEMFAAVAGAPVAERPVFSTHQLHRRAAGARRRHDRGEHRARPRRRADRHHADAADGYDGADERGRGHRRDAWPSCSRRSCSSSSRRPAAR